jgi:hypothetical protein
MQVNAIRLRWFTAGLDRRWREPAASGRDHRQAGDRKVSFERSSKVLAGGEAAELRDRAPRLLGIGVGDHTPIEVQEEVGEIARRLAEL